MTTLAVIMGGAAVILILVGLVGGGFTFSGSEMPTVGKTARVLCFTVGGMMLLMSISLAAYELSPDSSEPNEPTDVSSAVAVEPPQKFLGYVMASEGHVAYFFEEPCSCSTILAKLPNYSPVEILCTIQGQSVTSPVNGQTSSLWNRTRHGFISDAFVDTGTNQPTMPSC